MASPSEGYGLPMPPGPAVRTARGRKAAAAAVVEQPARVPNGDRRQAILDAAIKEFATNGFSGARVDRIAGNAQSNKQLIYYYFQSKASLYEAVLEEMISQTSRDHRPSHESISGAVGEHMEGLLGGSGEVWIRIWLWEALESDPEGAHREADRAEVWARWVAEFERAQARGEISKRFDTRMIALAVNSLIVTPYMTPTITKLITGYAPNSKEFKKQQKAMMRQLLELLSS
jgi:TetR/AcrR family transcriptional regulator